MREIVIKTFQREGKSYTVRLGNGTVHRFTSSKLAAKFLADTNSFLTTLTFNLNDVLVDLYRHYREIWIISPELKGRSCQDDFETLEMMLRQAFLRASSSQGNYFTFINLRKFIEHSEKLIKTFLTLKLVSDKDTHRRHSLQLLFDQVHLLEQKLSCYGKREAVELFDTNQFDALPLFDILKKSA